MYTIGQTSEKTGFSRDTLRYYEKVGLIPPPSRLENGRRVYTDEDIETLHLLSSLKSTGLSIEEMTDIVKARKIALPNERKRTMNTVSPYRRKLRSFIDTSISWSCRSRKSRRSSRLARKRSGTMKD
ncbi:MerR family transcriptional regulator [Rossellomorea sp. H39__3]